MCILWRQTGYVILRVLHFAIADNRSYHSSALPVGLGWFIVVGLGGVFEWFFMLRFIIYHRFESSSLICLFHSCLCDLRFGCTVPCRFTCRAQFDTVPFQRALRICWSYYQLWMDCMPHCVTVDLGRDIAAIIERCVHFWRIWSFLVCCRVLIFNVRFILMRSLYLV